MTRRRKTMALGLGVVFAAALGYFFLRVRVTERELRRGDSSATPAALSEQCDDWIGPPRVQELAPDVYVALGYDLANTILVRTAAGNVVVDVGGSPDRAKQARAALEVQAPGGVNTVIFTHSHIDHVGGATAWVDEGTTVWATKALIEHFFKQYGTFRKAESRRGAHQFGWHASRDELPCSALGRRLDLDTMAKTGALMPTNTFSGRTGFEVGGVRFELVEAHGETHDQLFVWIPDKRILLSGDNLYHAFPNLYTLRGTSPRPVDAWIASIDRMRALGPEILIPSHTTPIVGEERVRQVLVNYRDGIQWVRDEVVRGANAGLSMDELAARTRLPKHLADDGYLKELYGQVDWSVRAIYTNRLGWFDERAEDLYPLAPDDEARRMVEMMGGAEAVGKEIDSALARNDNRWALRLTGLLRDAGASDEQKRARALRAVASGVYNTNGRGYLLEEAWQLENGPLELTGVRVPDGLVDSIPLSLIFDVMQSRLAPGRAQDVHESVIHRFPDEGKQFVVTVRNGIAEVVEGKALPGTPKPIAEVQLSARVFREVALGLKSPASATAAGDVIVTGDRLAYVRFMQRFERGM